MPADLRHHELNDRPLVEHSRPVRMHSRPPACCPPPFRPRERPATFDCFLLIIRPLSCFQLAVRVEYLLDTITTHKLDHKSLFTTFVKEIPNAQIKLGGMETEERVEAENNRGEIHSIKRPALIVWHFARPQDGQVNRRTD